jgi:hypothetical protein
MNTKEIYMYALGALVALGFFSITFYLIYSAKYDDAVMLIIGALISAFSTVIGYFFGSSKGSADKTELMNK